MPNALPALDAHRPPFPPAAPVRTLAAVDAPDTSDEALMLAYAAGDAGAFGQLYARHRTRLYRYLLRQLRDSGSPLVITQDGRPAAVLLTPEAYDALAAAAPIRASMDSFSTPPAPPAEDVVGWLDTWATENEIPLPPAFPA